MYSTLQRITNYF
jgi:hypothetical protein